jgi:hypothetical protein
MKKVIAGLLILIFSGCVPATMITGSWKSPTLQSKQYESILVAALTSHTVAKATVETDLADLLVKDGINVTKGIDLFPPQMINADSDRQKLMHKIRGKGIDAILTVSMIKKQTEMRYDGPAPGYEYYQNFWGYYSYWYPSFYNPAYYSEQVYYIETNLYDAKTEKIMWSAQSRAYDLLDLPTFSKQFAQSIVSKLEQDQAIKAPKRSAVNQ